MTAKPYPHAVQKAARRGVLSASGSKRVDVMLDARELKQLALIREEYGCKNGEAVRLALATLSGQINLERRPEGF
jgi:hypothetical protein